MCAICGIFCDDLNPPVEEAMVRCMRDSMIHRGPDDAGIETGHGWCLGFRRLAILDLKATGHQPMYTPERDAVIVFNGEIYNYRELRDRLAAVGERCDSTGDTEVLLRTLRREGRAALDRLNGMFAFAFVNLRTREFIIARDRLGVKPLYYRLEPRGIEFASELPALCVMRRGDSKVDAVALNLYMVLGYIPPPRTVWCGIQKLPPGSCIIGSLDAPQRVVATRWWVLDVRPECRPDLRASLDELDALLMDATRIRLASDVPVGVFLSGGIDSGLVAHYAAQQRDFAAPIAFTVAFNEREYSELEAARLVARVEKLDHRIVTVESESLGDLAPIVRHAGEPFADTSMVNQFLLARAARQHATVFLTGDGGDEAFGGYNEYKRMAERQRSAAAAAFLLGGGARFLDGALPSRSILRERLWKLSGGMKGFGALVRANFRDPVARALIHPDVRVSSDVLEEPLWTCWERSADLDLIARMQRFDYEQYLEPDVLVKVDRATMAHSIEARSPFLDHRVTAFAARIPTQEKVDSQQTKKLLRALAKRYLPQDHATLPKKGFGLPIASWLRTPRTRDFVNTVLFSDRARKRGWLEQGALRDLMEQNVQNGRELHELVWRALMLEAWARVFVDGDNLLPLVGSN